MSKFDTSKLLPETVSLILSALIYDTEKFSDTVRDLFGFKVAYIHRGKIGKFLYALVNDEVNKRHWIIFRGTGGDNWFGRMLSWFQINFRFATNSLGFHSGFYTVADKAFNDIVKQLKYAAIYISGHSQGGGTSAVMFAKLCYHKITYGLKWFIQADLWSAPPAVKKEGKKEIDMYIEEKIGKCFNWIEPGDLIYYEGLRQEKGILAGRDIGIKIELPDIILGKYGFLDWVSHSPTLVMRAYQIDVPHQYDRDVIEHVLENKMVIN